MSLYSGLSLLIRPTIPEYNFLFPKGTNTLTPIPIFSDSSEGTRYVKQLRDYLNENADLYPDYKISSCYEESGISRDYNNEDSGLYVFG